MTQPSPLQLLPDAEILAILDGEDLPPQDSPEAYQEHTARVAADRYLFALRNVTEQLEAAKAEHRAYLEHLNLLHERRTAPLERAIAWLEAQLEDLAKFIPTRGKAKSVKLLGGTIGKRHQPEHFTVEDPAAALPIVEARFPEAIKRTPKIVAKDLDTALKQALGDGELQLAPDGTPSYQLPGTGSTGPAGVAPTFEIVAGVRFVKAADNFYATPAPRPEADPRAFPAEPRVSVSGVPGAIDLGALRAETFEDHTADDARQSAARDAAGA